MHEIKIKTMIAKGNHNILVKYSTFFVHLYNINSSSHDELENLSWK